MDKLVPISEKRSRYVTYMENTAYRGHFKGAIEWDHSEMRIQDVKRILN